MQSKYYIVDISKVPRSNSTSDSHTKGIFYKIFNSIFSTIEVLKSSLLII